MMELITRLLTVSSLINFILISSILYFLVKHIIPTYFSKKAEENQKDFEALVRQKKQELTSTTVETNGFSFTVDTQSESKSEFLKNIEEKFPHHSAFYKKLEASSSWQESVLNKDFYQIYPAMFMLDLPFLELKKIFSQSNYDLIHRGDYANVLLLIWLEKFYYCLKFDQPLPKNASLASLSLELPLWRWALMRITMENTSWQNSRFDNLAIFNTKKNEIFSVKNLLDLTKNSKVWWNKLASYVYQIEPFYALDDYDMKNMNIDKLSKKEKLQILKRYHPDTVVWDLIAVDLRADYESMLNDNFSRVSDYLKD